MKIQTPVSVVVEGTTDAAVTKRLLAEAGLTASSPYIRGGKAAVDQRLIGYNSAGRFSCWLVLRDLDHDAACAAALRWQLLPSPSQHIRLHIAVRAVEAWLMADAESFGQFFGVSSTRIPMNPEALDDPKGEVVSLTRHSKKRSIRDGMAPSPGTSARVGPLYSAYLSEFASVHWRPSIAERASPSLARLRRFLHGVDPH